MRFAFAGSKALGLRVLEGLPARAPEALVDVVKSIRTRFVE